MRLAMFTQREQACEQEAGRGVSDSHQRQERGITLRRRKKSLRAEGAKLTHWKSLLQRSPPARAKVSCPAVERHGNGDRADGPERWAEPLNQDNGQDWGTQTSFVRRGTPGNRSDRSFI